MIVDCDRCVVRGDACAGCVITVLLGAPPGGVQLDSTERRAIDALATAGLVPRLRLVQPGADAVSQAAPAATHTIREFAGSAAERAERPIREAG
jgi:hypothetical protein